MRPPEHEWVPRITVAAMAMARGIGPRFVDLFIAGLPKGVSRLKGSRRYYRKDLVENEIRGFLVNRESDTVEGEHRDWNADHTQYRWYPQSAFTGKAWTRREMREYNRHNPWIPEIAERIIAALRRRIQDGSLYDIPIDIDKEER